MRLTWSTRRISALLASVAFSMLFLGLLTACVIPDVYTACYYKGALYQFDEFSTECQRGEVIDFQPGEDYYACVYRGAVSQFGTTEPANCGRGYSVGLAAGTDYHACVFRGAVSKFSTTEPANCGRGELVSLSAGIIDSQFPFLPLEEATPEQP
jgi:hypothetical protein